MAISVLHAKGHNIPKTRAAQRIGRLDLVRNFEPINMETLAGFRRLRMTAKRADGASTLLGGDFIELNAKEEG